MKRFRMYSPNTAAGCAAGHYENPSASLALPCSSAASRSPVRIAEVCEADANAGLALAKIEGGPDHDSGPPPHEGTVRFSDDHLARSRTAGVTTACLLRCTLVANGT